MKLLFAIKSLNVEGGGAERVLVDIVNGLAARGHEIRILTFDSPGDSFYKLDAQVERIDADFGVPGSSVSRLAFFRAIPRLRRLVKIAGTDLIVAFMHSSYVPLALALMGTGCRIIASEHAPASHYRMRPFERFLIEFADRLILAKTVPSDAVSREYSRRSRCLPSVVPNPVYIEKFLPDAKTIATDSHLLLSVGRMRIEKGHLDLLRAFSLIAGEFPEWMLRLVGDGELRENIEREIAALGLRQRVQLPGTSRHVAAEYARASIVVLPSLYESFGLVAAEALASGRAVIAFEDCQGIAEMIENGRNGLLIKAGGDRVVSLADGLRRLMSDREMRNRLATAGPDSVRRFALDEVVTTWENFLTGLFHGDPR